MYSPTTRVLAVLGLLQSRGTVSGAELVKRLEVDPRTVRRYVTMLRDIGVPVESTPGRGGGYRLGQGSKLPPLMFDDGEALAIVVSLLQAVARGRAGVEQRDIESALTKISRVLPRDLKSKLAAVQSGVAFTTYDPAAALASPPPDTDASFILTLASARHLGQRVRLGYQDWRGVETSREVDPYGLVQHLGTWYLAGWRHLRDGVVLDARAEDLSGMARFLVSLGCPFVVRAPDELREELAKRAAELSRASRQT